MMLASYVMAGVVDTSRCSGVRWCIILELVELDLCSYDVSIELLNLLSVREFVELVESDSDIGAWSR